MSKRSKKDIEGMSGLLLEGNVTVPASHDAAPPSLTIDGTEAKKSSAKKSARSGKLRKPVDSRLAEEDDPELQKLLLEVDNMLTEMTQSKWLSSEWPSLEIDFGPNAKVSR